MYPATLEQSSSLSARPTKKFEYNLEALRGYAALFVVWHHAFWAEFSLDPNYSLSGIWTYNPPGHLSVLIFFVLSGYVIGLANPTPLTSSTIWPYLKKRLVRLYPIYLACLLGALAVTQTHYPLTQTLGHLAFAQLLVVPLIGEISPSWSLHFEVLFYLLFIPVSLCRLPPLWAVGLTVLAGSGVYYAYPGFNFPILTAYLYGFSFWACGLVLAQNFRTGPQREPVRAAVLVSGLLLILCLEEFNLLKLVLNRTGLYLKYPDTVNWQLTLLGFIDFAYLPYCLFFILIFTNKAFPWRRQLLYGLYLAPVVVLLSLARKTAPEARIQYALPGLFYLLSLLLLLSKHPVAERVCQWIIARGIYLGSISYGVYLVHFPVQALLKQITLFSGSAVTYVFRFLFLFIVTIALGHVLEKKFHPWAKKAFN